MNIILLHPKNKTAVTSSLGVHLTDNFCSDFNISIDLAWLYRFAGNDNFQANLDSLNTDFTVYGPRSSRNSGEGAITLTKTMCDSWSIFVEASGEVWNRSSIYDVRGGIQANW